MLQAGFLDREDTGFTGRVSRYGVYWCYRTGFLIGGILVLKDRFLDREGTGITGQVSR